MLEGCVCRDRIPKRRLCTRGVREVYKGISDYIEARIDEGRSKQPGNDVIGWRRQQRAEAQGCDRVLHQGFYAAQETSTVMLSSGLHSFLQHPERLRRLPIDPSP